MQTEALIAAREKAAKLLSTNQSVNSMLAPDQEATDPVLEGEPEAVQDQYEDGASGTGAVFIDV